MSEIESMIKELDALTSRQTWKVVATKVGGGKKILRSKYKRL